MNPDPEQQPPSGGGAPPEQTDVQSHEHEDEGPTPEDFEEDPSLNPDDEALKDIKGG